MSQTDPRAVAKAGVFQISQIDAGYGCCLTEGAMDLIAHALADAERRGLERAAKVVEQMKIQTCAIRNETAIIHELLLKVESRIEKAYGSSEELDEWERSICKERLEQGQQIHDQLRQLHDQLAAMTRERDEQGRYACEMLTECKRAQVAEQDALQQLAASQALAGNSSLMPLVTSLQAQLKGTKDAKDEIQDKLAIAEAGVNALNEEVADWRDRAKQLQATLAAREARVRELEDQMNAKRYVTNEAL